MHDRVLFFNGRPARAPASSALPDGYQALCWRPSIGRIVPPGGFVYPFGVYWLFHAMRLFRNREYGAFLILRDGICVHRSVVFPGFFRFPFMEAGDLQVGFIWTAENERGRGLAKLALLSLLAADPNRERTYWYLVDDDNPASIRLVESANFCCCGVGTRRRKRIFAAYQIKETYD